MSCNCKTPIRCKNRINHLSPRNILVFSFFAKMCKEFKILCAKKTKNLGILKYLISTADRLDLKFLE